MGQQREREKSPGTAKREERSRQTFTTRFLYRPTISKLQDPHWGTTSSLCTFILPDKAGLLQGVRSSHSWAEVGRPPELRAAHSSVPPGQVQASRVTAPRWDWRAAPDAVGHWDLQHPTCSTSSLACWLVRGETSQDLACFCASPLPVCSSWEPSRTGPAVGCRRPINAPVLSSGRPLCTALSLALPSPPRGARFGKWVKGESRQTGGSGYLHAREIRVLYLHGGAGTKPKGGEKEGIRGDVL